MQIHIPNPIHIEDQDLPVTPTGRQLLSPDLYQVMNLAMGLTHEIDVDAIKSHFLNSIMLNIPRFSSLVNHNSNDNLLYFTPTRVNIDNHVIVVQRHDDDHNRAINDGINDVVNDYLAELAVSSPLSTDKPLWEVHILVNVKCLVLRVHHAICDGSTLLSVINEIGRKAGAEDRERGKIVMMNSDNGCREFNTISGWKGKTVYFYWLMEHLVHLYYSLVFCTQLLARFFIVKDKKSAVNNDGGNYVKCRPQGMATAKFSLDDFNIVRKAISNATINDVLLGVIWGGLVRFLDARSNAALQEGQQVTGMAMVNLRKQKGLQDISEVLNNNKESNNESWLGNKFSAILVPLHYTNKVVDPLDYVRKAKSIMDKKKRYSSESRILIKVQRIILCIFGLKFLNYLTTMGACNSSFLISNIMGPSKEIAIGDNPVTFIRLSVGRSPMQLMMHFVSYMKNLELQILVASDVISDPKFLADCFRETLKSMKNAVEETNMKQVLVKKKMEDVSTTPPMLGASNSA